MTEIERIDMSGVLHLLEEIQDLLSAMDGMPLDVPTEDRDRVRRSQNARRGRELLWAAHLADCLRLDIESQYYRFKGFHPREILRDGADRLVLGVGAQDDLGLPALG